MIEIGDIELRLKKAEARAEKAKSAYSNAVAEVARLQTALAVVKEIAGPGDATIPSAGQLTPKQKCVINALKIGRNNAMGPIDVYQAAASDSSFDGDVNYVRTTLWRMADKGTIGNADGTYWRLPTEAPGIAAQPHESVHHDHQRRDSSDEAFDEECPF